MDAPRGPDEWEQLQPLGQRPANPTVDVTAASLPAVISGHPVVVVDFWAPWCGPCRLLDPVIEVLARELRGQVVFARLNVDDDPTLAASFDVAALPTLLVFRQGALADRIVGLPPPEALRRRLAAGS